MTISPDVTAWARSSWQSTPDTNHPRPHEFLDDRGRGMWFSLIPLPEAEIVAAQIGPREGCGGETGGRQSTAVSPISLLSY